VELQVKALASGSSGNAYLVQAREAALLVEAGVPARVLDRHLQDHGVCPQGLAGILVSHEHTDHGQSAMPLARRYRAPIVANRATLDRLAAVEGQDEERAASDGMRSPRRRLPELQVLPSGRMRRIGPFEVTSFRVPHDAADPVGFLIGYDGWHICVATDLGEACPALVEPLRRADLVILEANHDPVALRNGYYPAALKQRIAGRDGHLSNEQAAALLIDCCRGLPSLAVKSVWLAHLSAHNNSRRSALQTVEGALWGAQVRRHVATLDVAARDRPSVEWRAHYVQRSLF
jgi:phosphoribosyl 1,2-cyclic phosphodiesterase